MFTTIDNVRQITGTVDNTNIPDAYITTQIQRAQGVMISKLAARYAMPFPSYYTNQILFTGTGTGTGILTITVNGVGYNVNVINGMTAEQAADAFRTAALATQQKDFVTDEILSGTTVNMYSAQPNWSQGVFASVPGAVDGITAALVANAYAEIQLPTIEHICCELAADYIIMGDYGSEVQLTTADWKDKKKDTMMELEELHLGEMYLIDFAGNFLPPSAVSVPLHFPTAASSCQYPDPTYSRGRMNKRF